MNWLTPFVLFGAFVGVRLQCLTSNDDEINSVTYNTDLSGINDFSIKLYKQLSPGNSQENFFFSPYSIWNALTLAYFGSAGNTQKQLQDVLNVPGKLSTLKLWRELEGFYERRQQNSTDYTFDVANRAYFDRLLDLNFCAGKFLGSELRVTSFSNLTGSAGTINKFVSEATRGRIKTIVQPSDLVNTVLVLVNAAFFKGTWQFQFDPSDTHTRDFHVSSQVKHPLSMMSQTGRFLYGDSLFLGARILELPYSTKDISMFLLLPRAGAPLGAGFAEMVNNMNAITLQDALDPKNLRFASVDVQLPRFKFEYTVQDLIGALQNMGITDLFDRFKANLTTFSNRDDLFVSKAIHKAFIEVNEEGTEAAAATALVIPIRSSFTPLPIQFHCNEPFIFIIHDNFAKNILFMGAIKNPRG